MLVLVSLFGFVPDRSVQVGEDAPGLAFTPAVQREWSERPLVRAMQEDLGPWTVRWDERNGTPRTLRGPSLAPERGPELLVWIGALAGIHPGDLELEQVRSGDRFTGLRYRQHAAGAPVEFGFVDLVLDGGRIAYVVASLHHVELDRAPAPGEQVLPRPDGTFALVQRLEEGPDVVYVDATGAEVHRWSRELPLEVTFHEREPGGALLTAPLREVFVSDGVTTELTGWDGSTTLAGPLDIRWDGPLLTMDDNGPIPVTLDVDDGIVDLDVDEDSAITSGFAFFWQVWDWLELRDPAHAFLPEHVDFTANANGSCNAFYSGDAITFYEAGGGCPNMAELADVVYHEYGHGVHDNGLVAGFFAGDVSEGSADFVSATINDDPEIAVGFFGPGTFLRELATNQVYPQDLGEVHYSGLIWGGFWWDVRTELVAQLGYEDGTELTDQLFLDALKLGPAINEFDAVLAADDDNGDPTDGTPNDCTLVVQGALHGIAPDPFTLIGAEVLDGGDVPTARPTDPPRVVRFALVGADECASIDPGSVQLAYTVEPPADANLEDLAFTEVPATAVGTDFEAAIPVQPAGTQVAYYVTWTDGEGLRTAASHGGRATGLYRYWVGDQADLWCDDFESGGAGWTLAGELEIGEPPAERAFGATSAASGSAILGQNLTTGAPYGPDRSNRALSPFVSLGEAERSMLLLTFQRWLTVDAEDTAQVGETTLGPVWSSSRTAPTLDGGWTAQTLDLRRLLDDEIPSAQVQFTLTTDGSGAFDGWNVDDVCVRALADVPGHYRDAGLVASDDLADRIEVAWTQPFVRPLFATALVRKQSGVPQNVEDGELLLLDEDPVMGAPASYVDEDVAPGEAWNYALFAADANGEWFDAALGENADAGLVPGGGTATDPTAPPAGGVPEPGAEAPAQGGCGCDSSGAPSALALGAAAALLVRRRRG